MAACMNSEIMKYNVTIVAEQPKPNPDIIWNPIRACVEYVGVSIERTPKPSALREVPVNTHGRQ